MRIAYVCADPGVPVFGRKGASVHVQEVLRSLRRRGCGVTLFSPRVEGERPEGLADLDLAALSIVKEADPRRRELALLACSAELPAVLEASGPLDMVYERHSLWSSGAMEFARDAGVPALLEVNAPLVEEQARYRTLVLRAQAEQAASRAFAAADRVLAVSRGVADYVQRCGVERDRIIVVPNAVDPDRFRHDTVPAVRRRSGGLTIGFVGTLKPWHGVEILVQAFERFLRQSPESTLLIVGDGPQRPSLCADLTARKLDENVVLTGAVDPAAVPGLLASMDIAVAPYPAAPDNYFSPLKIFEYMASGRAIVASRVGQVAEILDHGRTAWLVEPGSVEELVRALVTLAADRDTRVSLGAAARVQALARHTWDHVAGTIVACAEQVRAGSTGALA